MIRSRDASYPDGTFRSAFARDLDARIPGQRSSEAALSQRPYLTWCGIPAATRRSGRRRFFARLGRAGRCRCRGRQRGPEEARGCHTRHRRGPRALPARRSGFTSAIGLVFSEPMEFLHELVVRRAAFRCHWRRADRSCALHKPCDLRPRGSGNPRRRRIALRRHARAQGISGVHPAWPVQRALSLPFELIVTQSFAFLSKADAKTVLTRKQNQLVSAKDPAASRSTSSASARRSRVEPIRARRSSPLAPGLRPRRPQLQDHMSEARRALADAGAVSPGKIWDLRRPIGRSCPGCSNTGPALARSTPAISRRSLRSTPIPPGQAGWQPLGTGGGDAQDRVRLALTIFPSITATSATPSSAAPPGPAKPSCKLSCCRRPSGSARHYVFFDKDRGAEIFVRAAGGTYLTLHSGAPTGCAPLKALELTPANLSFLGELVRKLVTPETGR